MDRWANYAVVAVRYDSSKTHIDKVKVREDAGDKLTSEDIWEREKIIKQIKADKSFVTAIKMDNGKFGLGERIHVITVNGKEFLRTDKNQEESDNLGDLSTF